MKVDLSIEWIEGIEIYFECENVVESQKFKVDQEIMREKWSHSGSLCKLRVKIGKGPIVSWKGMVAKIKETYLPKDYEV